MKVRELKALLADGEDDAEVKLVTLDAEYGLGSIEQSQVSPYLVYFYSDETVEDDTRQAALDCRGQP